MNNTGHTFYYAMAKIDKEILTAKQKTKKSSISAQNKRRTNNSHPLFAAKRPVRT